MSLIKSATDPKWTLGSRDFQPKSGVTAIWLQRTEGAVRRGQAEMTARRDSSTYRSEIASPLRSALAINPTCRPDSVNTAPFSFCSTIARAPTTRAAPAPAPP
jgi:hypothetical protein